ncbi:MAG TPA: arsenate reductase ArsC [Micropepsaceae bacterium]|jgi:arsenate reductase|nr:arsenate reductase ArsC [Micropepsaceae bacterium]
MSETRPYNILFLCTGNSARSVLAEAYLNSAAGDRFRAFSAGSHPKGAIHPMTLDTLKIAHLPIEGLRSKSWNEFASPDAPKMDFVVTVCDSAAGEVCPVWPGQPITAHWSFPDPAAFEGREIEQRAFFLDVFRQIRNRLDILRNLPLARLGRLAVKHELDDIGRNPG